jgi:5-(hydroxymethyl)furfural/furfural oxidase
MARCTDRPGRYRSIASRGSNGPASPTPSRTRWSDAGFSDIDDQNARFEDGYFPQTLSNDGTHRVSAAMAYVGPAVRARPNLGVMAERQVRRLVLRAARC